MQKEDDVSPEKTTKGFDQSPGSGDDPNGSNKKNGRGGPFDRSEMSPGRMSEEDLFKLAMIREGIETNDLKIK